MPNIKLNDQIGAEIEVELNEASAIAKYLKDLKKLKLSELKFDKLENTPLDKIPVKSLTTGINFEQPVGVGVDGTEMKIGAGVSGGLKLSTPKDKQLFDAEFFGDPITIGPNQLYLSLQIGARLAVTVNNKMGELSFGFGGGTDITLRTSRLFEKGAAGAFQNCVDALKLTVASLAIPGDLADLEAMPSGSVATVEGLGKLKFSGALNLLSVVNPLAAINLPDPAGELKISSGGEIKVGASIEISGAYQLRVQKTGSDKIRLGYYKRRGTEFGLSVSASVGVSAGLGKFDLLELVLKGISSNPKADVEELKKGGLTEDQIAAIQKVIDAGVSRKIELALGFELSSAQTSEAAFLFDLEISKLDQAARQAIHHALDGDLTALTEKPQPGVSLVRSILTEVQKKKHAVKFNLLGIYNFISVSTLILKGRVMFEPATGELIITDTATASRIAASTFNFAADSEKLRKVLVESVILSIAYQFSKLVTHEPQLKVSHSHFELHTKSDRDTLKNNLDVSEALGLMTRAEKNKFLGGTQQFGRTTFYAETSYDDEVANSLFLNNGKPRSTDEYERAGRSALALLVNKGDKDEFRRLTADPEIWKEMKKKGFANFKFIPQLKSLKPVPLETVTTDYTVIRWWADAMVSMGEHLAEMRQFFKDNPNPDNGNKIFQSLRNKLASKLKDVAGNARSEFGDPWGLVAMDQLTAGKAAAKTLIVGSSLSILRERPQN